MGVDGVAQGYASYGTDGGEYFGLTGPHDADCYYRPPERLAGRQLGIEQRRSNHRLWLSRRTFVRRRLEIPDRALLRQGTLQELLFWVFEWRPSGNQVDGEFPRGL